MTTTQTASERITEEVTSWPGVEIGSNARGGDAFVVGRREIGHLHGPGWGAFARQPPWRAATCV